MGWFGKCFIGYLVLLAAFAIVTGVENVHLGGTDLIAIIWGPLVFFSVIGELPKWTKRLKDHRW